MIKQSNIDLLQFAADPQRMHLEAISDLISILTEKCDELIEESENLEYGDLVAGLDFDQRHRASVVDSEIDLLVGLIEICYDLKNGAEEDDDD